MSGIDDYLAARRLTAHLLDLGHRRIGFILGRPGHGAAEERHRGFVDEMRARNVPIDANLIATGNFQFPDGVICADKLLRAAHRPTAIFASNDDTAAAVISVARQLDLELPADLSVVGFDDAPIASMIWPLRTTVRQPVVPMARIAAELIIEHSPRRRDHRRAARQHRSQHALIATRAERAIPRSTAAGCLRVARPWSR
jgi:LacI family transcriptional regulator